MTSSQPLQRTTGPPPATPPRAGAGAGEALREDLRVVSGVPAASGRVAAGAGHAAARRLLGAEEFAALTRLNDARSLLAIGQTFGLIAPALTGGLWGLRELAGEGEALGYAVGGLSLALAMITLGITQHGLFILAHEAAHCRLLANRGLNDALGRLIGMASGKSMCTYRVIHRLHHNHLPRLHRLLRDKGVFDGDAEVRDLAETLGRIFAPRRARAPA